MSSRTTTAQGFASRILSKSGVARLFGILLAFAGWTALSIVFPHDLMPLPHVALLETWTLVESGVVYPHLSATIWRALFGFSGAMMLGITFGVFMGLTNYGRHFLTPWVIIGLSIPGVAWGAVMTLIVGYNNTAPIMAAVLTVFPYVAVNIWKGVENIEQPLIEMSSSFDVSPLRILLRLIIPNIAPSLFTASRFGLAISWRIVVITEIFSANTGIGIKIIKTYNNFRFHEAWAWAIVFMLLILVIEYGVFRPLERWMYTYRQDVKSVGF